MCLQVDCNLLSGSQALSCKRGGSKQGKHASGQAVLPGVWKPAGRASPARRLPLLLMRCSWCCSGQDKQRGDQWVPQLLTCRPQRGHCVNVSEGCLLVSLGWLCLLLHQLQGGVLQPLQAMLQGVGTRGARGRCRGRGGLHGRRAHAALLLQQAQGPQACPLLRWAPKARQADAFGVERGAPRPPRQPLRGARRSAAAGARCRRSARLGLLTDAALRIQQADVAAIPRICTCTSRQADTKTGIECWQSALA